MPGVGTHTLIFSFALSMSSGEDEMRFSRGYTLQGHAENLVLQLSCLDRQFINDILEGHAENLVLQLSCLDRQFINDILNLLPTLKNWEISGFPGGSVFRNPPANAEDMDSIPCLGRLHMSWNI